MYEIKRNNYHSVACYGCKTPLMTNCFMLVTSSMGGRWYYCSNCARDKGYGFEDFKDKLPYIDHDICKQISDKLPYFSPNFP